jgi:hypothetical protein
LFGRRSFGGSQPPAHDDAAVVGFPPLGVFDESIAASGVHRNQILRRFGGIEGELGGAELSGTALHCAEESGTKTPPLKTWLNAELAEHSNERIRVPGSCMAFPGRGERNGSDKGSLELRNETFPASNSLGRDPVVLPSGCVAEPSVGELLVGSTNQCGELRDRISGVEASDDDLSDLWDRRVALPLLGVLSDA